MAMESDKMSALFICLGNICRSPIAEAVFINLLNQKGLRDKWKVDSAALGSWHVGGRPDRRAIACLKRNNITDYSHVVRQITANDYGEFDYIFGMDQDNMKQLEVKSPPDTRAKLLLLGSFDPEGERIIRDPYYDDDDHGFEKCYQQCTRSCAAFLSQLEGIH